MVKTVNLIISGRVQGVFYRVKTQAKAMSLNLGGWVRNNPDGKVEAMVQGEDEQVKKLITWCENSSPGLTKKVEQEWLDTSEKFVKFEILY